MSKVIANNQVWRRLENGEMELLKDEKVEVNIDVESTTSQEYFLLELDFRLSMLELGF